MNNKYDDGKSIQLSAMAEDLIELTEHVKKLTQRLAVLERVHVAHHAIEATEEDVKMLNKINKDWVEH